MSIMRCEQHQLNWDSDKLDDCPECENEPEKAMTANTTLLACPFCGEAPKLTQLVDRCFIECANADCDISPKMVDWNTVVAATAWNRRADLAAIRAETLKEAAKVAKNSNFVDGPKGTIEGQIADAIHALSDAKGQTKAVPQDETGNGAGAIESPCPSTRISDSPAGTAPGREEPEELEAVEWLRSVIQDCPTGVSRSKEIIRHIDTLRTLYDAALLDTKNERLLKRLNEKRAVDAELARDAAEASVERLREWLDNNTTFYNVDADFPVEGKNIPVLAAVSERIWYHATDDIKSYPFSAVIDAAPIARSRDE